MSRGRSTWTPAILFILALFWHSLPKSPFPVIIDTNFYALPLTLSKALLSCSGSVYTAFHSAWYGSSATHLESVLALDKLINWIWVRGLDSTITERICQHVARIRHSFWAGLCNMPYT